MANTLYNSAREKFLKGQLDWTTAAIKCLLVDTGSGQYSFDAAHTSLANVPAGARAPTNGTAQSRAINNRTGTDGAADGDDVTFNAITGNNLEAIIIFVDTGVESTSTLIAYIDTATGLPITPNGGDIIITWDNGVNKIFRL